MKVDQVSVARSESPEKDKPESVSSRKHLLQVAKEEFLKNGFAQATVGNIARKSGYTTGAIYAHFSSKTDMLVKAIGLEEPYSIKEFVGKQVKVSGRKLAAFLSASILHASNRDATLLLDAAIESRSNEELAALILDRIKKIDSEYREVTRKAVAEKAIDPIFDDADLSAIMTTFSLGMLVHQAIGSGIPGEGTMTRFVAILLGLEDPDTYRASRTQEIEPNKKLEQLVEKRTKLKAEILEAISRASENGASLRAIGKITGDSHDKVRRILNDYQQARNEG